MGGPIDTTETQRVDRYGDALPLGVIAHRGYTPGFVTRMTRGYHEALARVAKGAWCDNGCGMPAAAVQPRPWPLMPHWMVVCVPDVYDADGLCPAASTRLIYALNLGEPSDEPCPQCSLRAAWTIDFPYSSQETQVADDFGCGGRMCLACGWRWDFGDSYVASPMNIHFAARVFPAASAAIAGLSFGPNDVVRHVLVDGREEPPLSSWLLDAIMRR